MKVGILSHSDDPMMQKDEINEIDENIPLPQIPDEEVVLENSSPRPLEQKDSMNINLQEMANLERQIELQESIVVD